MNPEQFWQKATDIHDLYHGLYRRAVLTDAELRATVPAYIDGIMALISEWYSAQRSSDSKTKRDNQEQCGAYTERWQELGKPEGWKGCSLPKGHEGNHTNGERKE